MFKLGKWYMSYGYGFIPTTTASNGVNMTTNQQLRSILDDPAYDKQLSGPFKSKRHQVATLLGIHKSRVDCWLLNPEASGYRNMPIQLFELLMIKLNSPRSVDHD